MERIKAKRFVSQLYISDFDGTTMDEAIELIRKKFERSVELTPDATDFKFNYDSGDYYINVICYVDETDLEYSVRIEREKNRFKALEQNYLRLKAQFEPEA